MANYINSIIPNDSAAESFVLLNQYIGFIFKDKYKCLKEVFNQLAQNTGNSSPEVAISEPMPEIPVQEDDFIEDLLMTTTLNYILFFTNKGRVFKLRTYQIPEAGRTARGVAMVNLLQLDGGEHVSAVVPIRDFSENKYFIMVTKSGMIKKTPQMDYRNIRKNGLIGITIKEDDELIEVKTTDDTRDIFMVTKNGMCIRFRDRDIRSTGRASMGVRGMNIDPEDEVVGMQMNTQGEKLLIVTENGMGKKTSIDEFNLQHRGGKGLKCYKITEKTGHIVGVKAVNEDHEVMLITTEGIIIQLRCDQISTYSRITSGVKLINMKDGEKVKKIAKVRQRELIEEDKNTDEEAGSGEISDETEDITEAGIEADVENESEEKDMAGDVNDESSGEDE